MIDTGYSLESLAMRSFEAATGTRTTTQACSISTTTGPTTTTEMSASADPSLPHLDAGNTATEGFILVENIPQVTAKARRQAKPKTAAEPLGAVVESGKESTSDFYNITTLPNLYGCWLKAKKNKGHSLRIQRFDADALNYIVSIQSRLRERTYSFGPYKTFTVKEKKFRDVVDAPMKDRIVHWMLYQYLLPIWEPKFIHDTYGNLKNRGSHAAIDRVAKFARSESCQWVLQLDISKYFYSVPHALLKERALRYIGDYEIRNLIIKLIDSYFTGSNYDHLFADSSLYRTTKNKGMPIGNLSSQLFANIYLNDFDHWLKETLRIKYYVRYVDDMVILGNSKEYLQQLCTIITTSLADEGITIHPKKIRIAPVSSGIPFLGYVIWPNHVSAGGYIRRRYLRTLREHESEIYDRSQALNSYKAALAHTGATV